MKQKSPSGLANTRYGGSIMLWGWFLVAGTERPVRFDGWMNAAKYMTWDQGDHSPLSMAVTWKSQENVGVRQSETWNKSLQRDMKMADMTFPIQSDVHVLWMN